MNLDLSHLNAKLVLPVDYKQVEFWLVGAGGTGSFMAMNLARLAYELKGLGKAASIRLVDPDRVEANNIPRSNFCFAEIGRNKAETLAGRIARAWGIEVGFVKEGFHPALLQQTKTDEWSGQTSNSNKVTILVGCVDNHLARRELQEALKTHNEQKYGNSSHPRLWWIDGGNGRDTGQVLIGNRINEKEICESAAMSPILSLLPAPSLQHPDLLRESENRNAIRRAAKDPVNCAERIRLGEQSLNINQRVAVEMSEMLSELFLTQTLKRFATYFDLGSGASRSIYNTPEAIADAAGYQPKRKSKTTGK
jgi:PRTRC genetic system ThiF family protein